MTQPWDYDILVKMLVIGDSAVGKTCLLERYSDNTFSYSHISTIGVDFKLKSFQRDGKIVKLQIWDTAGQERFRSMISFYYRGAHGIMLVYDRTNLESFQNLKHWIRDLRKYCSENVELILVGNKSDLKEEIVISSSEAREFAQAENIKYVIESSAKNGENVEKAFELLLNNVLESRNYLENNAVDEHKLNSPKKKSRPWWSYLCNIL